MLRDRHRDLTNGDQTTGQTRRCRCPVVLAASAIALGMMLPANFAQAQTAQVGYPPSNVEVRTAETRDRLRQAREANRQWQDSRLRRLTGNGDAAGGQVSPLPGSNAIAAARIATQVAIGAALATIGISAFTEDAGILAEAGSESGSPASDSSSTAPGTTSTSAATSTN